MAHDDLLYEPADTEFLGYELRDGESEGYIESVNGSQTRECEQFVPTVFELILIAKHWYRKYIEIRESEFGIDRSQPVDWRTGVYAERRLRRIRELLGDELWAEVKAEFDVESKTVTEKRLASIRAHCCDDLEIF